MKIKYNAPFTITFVILSSLVIVLKEAGFDLNGILGSPTRSLFQNSAFAFVGIFLHPLAHADLNHLASNLSLLLVISPSLEEKYGPTKMIFMSLVTSVTTSIYYMIFSPDIRVVGASGMVYMMILLSASSSLIKGRGIPLTMILALLFYVGKELSSAMSSQDNVAHLGHAIGGIIGAVFSIIPLNTIADKKINSLKKTSEKNNKVDKRNLDKEFKKIKTSLKR